MTQGQPGCETDYWQELRRFLEDHSVALLIPEVVSLEFEKVTRDLDKAYDLQCAKAEKYLLNIPRKEKLWNEMGDLLPFLEDQFESWKRSKIEGCGRRIQDVEQIFASDGVIHMSLRLISFLKLNAAN